MFSKRVCSWWTGNSSPGIAILASSSSNWTRWSFRSVALPCMLRGKPRALVKGHAAGATFCRAWTFQLWICLGGLCSDLIGGHLHLDSVTGPLSHVPVQVTPFDSAESGRCPESLPGECRAHSTSGATTIG